MRRPILAILVTVLLAAVLPRVGLACGLDVMPPQAGTVGPVPIGAELWIAPQRGWSEAMDVVEGGYLVVEAVAPPERSLETVTLWLSKQTPGACNAASIDEIDLGAQPFVGRYPVEPGRYIVGVLVSNRTHYRYPDDPAVARHVLVSVTYEPA
jgi:hypothetical protein